MSSVVKFYPKGSAKNPDIVLERSLGQYESVLIMGYDTEGRFDVRSSTNLNASDMLWLIEWFKARLMDGDYFDGETMEED